MKKLILTDGQIREHLLSNGWEEPWISRQVLDDTRRILRAAKPKAKKVSRSEESSGVKLYARQTDRT
jgi:hypothetical protein